MWLPAHFIKVLANPCVLPKGFSSAEMFSQTLITLIPNRKFGVSAHKPVFSGESDSDSSFEVVESSPIPSTMGESIHAHKSIQTPCFELISCEATSLEVTEARETTHHRLEVIEARIHETMEAHPAQCTQYVDALQMTDKEQEKEETYTPLGIKEQRIPCFWPNRPYDAAAMTKEETNRLVFAMSRASALVYYQPKKRSNPHRSHKHKVHEHRDPLPLVRLSAVVFESDEEDQLTEWCDF